MKPWMKITIGVVVRLFTLAILWEGWICFYAAFMAISGDDPNWSLQFSIIHNIKNL